MGFVIVLILVGLVLIFAEILLIPGIGVQPKDYVDNDTGEDCEIKDRPAGWGNIYDYRILDASSSMNFFKVKAQSIPSK